MNPQPTDFAGNIARFSGFADLYDQYRPAPPTILAPILTQLAQVSRPALVVDLGSGTGLSTRYWADKAERVIGVEPTADMRHQAERMNSAANLTYQGGFSHQTGLPDQCAQIVTCSQALHWMEPQATFEEARRILQPGGVFAAFDYDWPPLTGAWEADAAYDCCMTTARNLEEKIQASKDVKSWDKSQHLARMQASALFRYTKEITLHHVDEGNAEWLVGLLLSQGHVMSLLKQGVAQAELGIDDLRTIAQTKLGSAPRPWYWSSRVRIGIV